MNCPKCLENLATVAFSDVTVDHCPHCGGLFFDVTELDRMLAKRGAESIDTGMAPTSYELNPIPQIYCPRCLDRGRRVRMITLVDADHPDVRFERCPDCGGTWLEAGKFTELKHHAMADFVRGIQSRHRKQKETQY